MAQPKARVRRATVHLPAMGVMPVTVRGYGFRAACDCGWESSVSKTYAGARDDLQEHKLWHAGSLPA
jgi:hypothetical protein